MSVLLSPSEVVERAHVIRKGEEAIRSFKLLADWLRSQGYEPHRSESNAQFVGRVLREKIGKGGMP